MKATLFLSSIFFLLGLKVSSVLDLPGKANTVDKIISTKILNSKPLKAIPFWKASDENEEIKDENLKEDSSDNDLKK